MCYVISMESDLITPKKESQNKVLSIIGLLLLVALILAFPYTRDAALLALVYALVFIPPLMAVICALSMSGINILSRFLLLLLIIALPILGAIIVIGINYYMYKARLQQE